MPPLPKGYTKADKVIEVVLVGDFDRDPRSKRNKERHKKLVKCYGIGFDTFLRMEIKQRGACAICGSPESMSMYGHDPILVVDHNKITGQVRGLLCRQCNVKLGVVEDEQWMRLAQLYLERTDHAYSAREG